MTTAKEVREAAREKFLQMIRRRIASFEENIGKANLHRILLGLFEKELSSGRTWISRGELPDILQDHKEIGLALISVIRCEIRDFARSETEGLTLLAQLLQFSAGEIAQPYYLELQAQEKERPRMIYGTEHATDTL